MVNFNSFLICCPRLSNTFVISSQWIIKNNYENWAIIIGSRLRIGEFTPKIHENSTRKRSTDGQKLVH